MTTEIAASWLPFARLNLRCNPFGELARTDRAAAAVVDVEPWARWLEAGGRRAVQFMGDRGRGKTTHLLALQARLPAARYFYFPLDGPPPKIPDQDLLLLDEAQRIPWRARRRVFARGPAMALGTHTDLSRLLARFGYTVQTVEVAQRTNAEQIRKVMNRRLDLARLGPEPVPQLNCEDAERLAARFGDDLRGMEGYLYEQLQRYAGSEPGNKYGEVRLID